MRRGDIYWHLYDKTRNGSVEQGHRPVVIVSSDAGNETSSCVLVCPLTTTRKHLSCNVDVAWHTPAARGSQVLCNHIMSVSKETLHSNLGRLSDDELERVDLALAISLGLAVNR